MSIRKTYHVTKTSTGWKGKAEGAKRASVTGDTKKEVVRETIDLAKRGGNTSVIIHKENARFQEERTYPKSSDPRKSEG